MENRGKLYSIALASTALVFVFLIFVSAASSVQVTRIGNGSDPAIYGSKVAWTDRGVIHVYDLTTKTDTMVNSSAASYPAIYGNKLVWHDESNGTPRLAVYDIETAARSYITKDVDSYSIPAIYGNRIVWSANYNETNYNYNVYMRDISTSTQTRIAYGENPDIYDTRITYAAYDSGDWRSIFVYDIITGETTQVPYSGDLNNPHIYGNTVIWSDTYTRLGYIAMYDIVTKKVTAVTNDTGICDDGSESGSDTGAHTNIYGDKIVYAKASSDCLGSAGVYVYNISTAQSTQVFDYEINILTTPDVYDDTVVWGIDNRYSDDAIDNGIYIIDLSATNTLRQ
ncbi:cell surface protein [Methanosarcina horonobensis HB-1 = JCM 15518]|uniref:Cell surface protein n=1 Tax=Methanosarcina horonobensis HB-1 = JCM 15518 TaxID=1434110 RepID=A0A0E3SDK7_9EURY|nr:cell surface protein [Methanosarcina horonobensis HB-1 = JCM 15518]